MVLYFIGPCHVYGVCVPRVHRDCRVATNSLLPQSWSIPRQSPPCGYSYTRRAVLWILEIGKQMRPVAGLQILHDHNIDSCNTLIVIRPTVKYAVNSLAV